MRDARAELRARRRGVRRAGWIDADTPHTSATIRSYGDNSKHTLVMSDEFETPHRSPSRTARTRAGPPSTRTTTLIKPCNIIMRPTHTTWNGTLKLTTTDEDTEFMSHQVKNKEKVTVKVRKHFRSAMLQGWDKFCFRGGVLGR